MKTPYRPKKNLGQNFLVDARIQQRIVDACSLESDDTVVEIGPGKGAITRLIVPKVKHLIAVEKDRELVVLLKEELSDPRLEVFEEDFLKWDMKGFPQGLVVLGNIPYYISTPIIEKVLEHRDQIKRAYLMVQMEFGERLAAVPGNKDYGSLSCYVQYYADVKVLFKISPGSFHPQPKVRSCFVSLSFKNEPELQANDEEKLFKMIQTAFTQRRKTILNALKPLGEQERIMVTLERLGIDPKTRPEDLSLLNYIGISNSLMI